MKENEAIQELESRTSPYDTCKADFDANEAIKTAIKALKEVQQYRAIGTPEECRAAVEKQKPFKPETVGLTIGIGRCKCGAEFLDSKTNYCGNCGQKLNWNRRANDGKTD